MLSGYTIGREHRECRLEHVICGLSSRPGTVAMGDSQNDSVRSEGRVHNEEWQLVECVSSAAGEINRQRWGASLIVLIARSNDLSKLIAAAGLRS
jgi:hypothetical protein